MHGLFFVAAASSPPDCQLVIVGSVQMDSNRDGMVDFDEFVAATLHVHQLEESDTDKWQRRSRAAFEKFDFDKDGFITAEELKVVSELVLLR